jgi:hypothetical protein
LTLDEPVPPFGVCFFISIVWLVCVREGHDARGVGLKHIKRVAHTDNTLVRDVFRWVLITHGMRVFDKPNIVVVICFSLKARNLKDCSTVDSLERPSHDTRSLLDNATYK